MPVSRTVLLLVDFINPLRFPGADELAPAALEAARTAASLKAKLAKEQVQTVYANDNYGRWSSDFSSIWKSCRALGGPSGQMARQLKPTKKDCALLKPRHSAFYATPLDLLLRQLRCRRLILAGIAADNCVLFTAMDAYLRGYSLWVPADCVAAETDDAKIQALAQMRQTLKARVAPSLQ